MKNLDEFKKDVYERAEKAEAVRAEKIKTFTRIGSVAAAFAVVIISVFAVLGPGFSVSQKAAESVDSRNVAGAELYAVVNEEGEIEFFAEIDENGVVNKIDFDGNEKMTVGYGVSNTKSGNVNKEESDFLTGIVNYVSVVEFNNIVNNKNGWDTAGSSGAETVTEQQPSTTTTAASDAAISPETRSEERRVGKEC